VPGAAASFLSHPFACLCDGNRVVDLGDGPPSSVAGVSASNSLRIPAILAALNRLFF
jgi:hypothetical protein